MSYIGQQLPADTFSGFVTDAFTGDGSATTFTLSKAPFSENTLIVVINNVIQRPTTNFTVSGTTLTIVGTAVASGDVIYAIHMGGPLPIGQAAQVDANGVSDGVILDADGDTTIDSESDDTIQFKIAGTNTHSMTSSLADFNTPVAISVSDNSDTLTLKSTDADANSGPNLRLYRNSGSPAVGDNLGQIDFEGRNDTSEDVVYASMMARARDETDGTEDGGFQIDVMQGGTLRSLMKYYSDGAAQELSFNDDSIDVDFRVESDGNANMLKVDAGNNQVLIGGTGATFGELGITGHSNSDANIDMYASVGASVIGKAEIFFSTDSSSDHVSIASIVSQQPSGDQAARKGEILFNVSDNGGPSQALIIQNNGLVSGNLNDTSDENLKKNIEDLGASTDIIKALKPRKFDWKQTSAGSDIAGFVAQEVATVIPNAVVGNDYVATTFYEDGDTLPDGYIVGDVKEKGDKGKALNTTAILAHAVKTIQELEARIKTLEDA